MLMSSKAKLEAKLFTDNFPTPEQIRIDIAKEGFAIYSNAIDPTCVTELRSFWVNQFKWIKSSTQVVRGNLRLGETNFLSYSESDYWCLFREFAFLWNKPTHDLTTQIGTEIHKIRNIAQGFDPDYGLSYSADRYSMYLSTSWYEPNKGHLQMHVDGHKDVPILQYMLPITHKGRDFDGGGLCLQIGNGPKVDVDAIMKPGSIVFFDARNHHGVEKITCSDPNMIGRIATFAIPTFFKGQDEIPKVLRKAVDGYNWFLRKVDQIKGLKGGPTKSEY